MLTEADLQKITAVVDTMADVKALQEGVEEFREHSQKIMQAFDGIATSIDVRRN